MVPGKQIYPGDVLQINNWFGVVLEVHRDQYTNELSVLRVQTTRNVLRGYGPEYIDIRMNPDAIRQATMEELRQDLAVRKELIGRLEQQMMDAVADKAFKQGS